jgi:hypothetical protein
LFEHDLFGKPVPTLPDHALAQGSEARATFCSAKRLEDVKTTGKMKNIDAGMVPGTCQQSSPDASAASDRSIAATPGK